MAAPLTTHHYYDLQGVSKACTRLAYAFEEGLSAGLRAPYFYYYNNTARFQGKQLIHSST